MTLQLLHSEFPYRRGKFDFLFYQFNFTFDLRDVKVQSEKVDDDADLTQTRMV
jgi:hypothetical protein